MESPRFLGLPVRLSFPIATAVSALVCFVLWLLMNAAFDPGFAGGWFNDPSPLILLFMLSVLLFAVFFVMSVVVWFFTRADAT